MYERSTAVTRGIVFVSVCAVAALAIWIHLSRRGIVASQVSETYRVFDAPAATSIQARIGNGKTRSDVSAVAVMIWNRGDATIRTPRAARVILGPRKPIVALRTLAGAKATAHLVVDAARASSGEITISWAELDPDDGIALHIAFEGRGTAVRVEHLPTATYWAAGRKLTLQFIFLWVLFAIIASLSLFLRPGDSGQASATVGLAILAASTLLMASYFLPGYVQNPPSKLRTAIATRYPQDTVFPE